MKNVGEAWERNYRRRKMLILSIAVLLSGLTPLILKAVGDQNVVFADYFGSSWHLPLSIRMVIAIVFVGGLLLVGRWSWMAADEVRRSHLLSFWAATGYSVAITFFGFVLFGQYIPEPDRLRLAFMLPITMGAIFVVARWLRDGYAP